VDSSIEDTGTNKDTGTTTPDTGVVEDTGAKDTGTVADTGTDTGTVAVDSGEDASEDAGVDAAVCETGWPTDGGANIVTNPDFESGSTGWTALFGSSTVGVSTTFAHCGAQSGELSARTANYSNIAYSLPNPGTYNVALWVAHDAQVDGGGASMQMAVQGVANCAGEDGAVAQTFFNVAFPTIAANTFTFVSGSLTVPAGCTDISFLVSQNGTQNLTAPFPDIFIDDVYIAPQ